MPRLRERRTTDRVFAAWDEGGLRARHDGLRGNPWDDEEAGHHFARAMASWSLLVAATGFSWSAPDGALAFLPKVGSDAEAFRCFAGAPPRTLDVRTTGRVGEVTVAFDAPVSLAAGERLRLRRA